jgi:aminoglycoside phosphotransferase
MDTNEILTGGSMNLVVKVEDTVHRKVQGHPLLHSYLRYLEEAGMPGVPRFLGLDEEGREILTYLPGKTMGPDYPPEHPCFHTDDALTDMAQFLRRLHDVSAGFLPTALGNGWNDRYFPHETPETICHCDAAIWNFVFVEERLTGIFDFDQACPGSRAWDLTSTIFSAVGLVPYGYKAEWHAADRRRRIRLFFDAYGMACPPNFLELLIKRHQVVCDEMEEEAAAGMESSIKMIAGGGLAHYQRVVWHMKEHGREWF